MKVVPVLETALPTHHRYKIIFMWQPIHEILTSQHRMRYRKTPPTSDDRMVAILQNHEEQTQTALCASLVELLKVHYPELVREPLRHQDFLKRFLSPQGLPHGEWIAYAVRPELGRIRTTE